jgi:hypothetical protein
MCRLGIPSPEDVSSRGVFPNQISVESLCNLSRSHNYNCTIAFLDNTSIINEEV